MLDYLGVGKKKTKLTRKRGKHVQLRRKHNRTSQKTGGKVGGLDYFSE